MDFGKWNEKINVTTNTNRHQNGREVNLNVKKELRALTQGIERKSTGTVGIYGSCALCREKYMCRGTSKVIKQDNEIKGEQPNRRVWGVHTF